MKFFEVTHKLISGRISSKVYMSGSNDMRKVHDIHAATYPKCEIQCIREITAPEFQSWSEMAL